MSVTLCSISLLPSSHFSDSSLSIPFHYIAPRCSFVVRGPLGRRRGDQFLLGAYSVTVTSERFAAQDMVRAKGTLLQQASLLYFCT